MKLFQRRKFKFFIQRKFRFLLRKNLYRKFRVNYFSRKVFLTKKKGRVVPFVVRGLKDFLLHKKPFNSLEPKRIYLINKWRYYLHLSRRRRFQLFRWRRSRVNVRKRSSLKISVYRKKYLLRSRFNYLRKIRRFRIWRRKKWNWSVAGLVADDYFGFLLYKFKFRQSKAMFFSLKELQRSSSKHYSLLRLNRKYFYFSGFFKFKRIRFFWFRPLFGHRYTFFQQVRRWRTSFYSYYRNRKYKIQCLFARRLMRLSSTQKRVKTRRRGGSGIVTRKSAILSTIVSFPLREFKKLFIKQKKVNRNLKTFLALNYTQFKTYYKCLVIFKKLFLRVYLAKNKRFSNAKKLSFQKSLVSYNFPRKRLVCFFRRFELLLPVVLKRFFLIRKLNYALKVIHIHGVLLNNRLNTCSNTIVELGDLVECSFKSYLYLEPFMLVSTLVRGHNRFVWRYTYAFIVNLTYFIGIYYRLPNPVFVPFYQYLLRKKKRKFLNFFIHYSK